MPIRIRVVPGFRASGSWDSEAREITLREGEVVGSVLGHEIAHAKLGHNLLPKTARGLVGDEIDAYVWSYSRSRQPVHMKRVLRNIINEATEVYSVTPIHTWHLLHNKLSRTRGTAKTWRQDLKELKQEAQLASEH